MGNHLRLRCIVNHLASALPRASWRSFTRRMRNGRIVTMLKYVSVEVSWSKADKTSHKLKLDQCEVSRCSSKPHSKNRRVREIEPTPKDRSCSHDCQRSEDALDSPPHAARLGTSSSRFPNMAARPKKGVVGGNRGPVAPRFVALLRPPSRNEVHVERLRNSTALWNLRFV